MILRHTALRRKGRCLQKSKERLQESGGTALDFRRQYVIMNPEKSLRKGDLQDEKGFAGTGLL